MSSVHGEDIVDELLKQAAKGAAIVFYRKPVYVGRGRLAFTIPRRIQDFFERDRTYKIIAIPLEEGIVKHERVIRG